MLYHPLTVLPLVNRLQEAGGPGHLLPGRRHSRHPRPGRRNCRPHHDGDQPRTQEDRQVLNPKWGGGGAFLPLAYQSKFYRFTSYYNTR
jgi:hypothetical protein